MLWTIVTYVKPIYLTQYTLGENFTWVTKINHDPPVKCKLITAQNTQLDRVSDTKLYSSRCWVTEGPRAWEEGPRWGALGDRVIFLVAQKCYKILTIWLTCKWSHQLCLNTKDHLNPAKMSIWLTIYIINPFAVSSYCQNECQVERKIHFGEKMLTFFSWNL